MFFGNLIFELTLLWMLKAKNGPNTLPMFRVCHNYSFCDKTFLPLILKTRDMCHTTVNFLVISWPKLETYKPRVVDVQVGPCHVHYIRSLTFCCDFATIIITKVHNFFIPILPKIFGFFCSRPLHTW